MNDKSTSKQNNINALILGAGRGDPIKEGQDSLPKPLLTDPFGNHVLDWVLSAFREVNTHNITFAGGFRIEDIGEQYKYLTYVYNPEWKTSGVLSSMYHGRDHIKGTCFVAYGDIVFRPYACKMLMSENVDGIRIAVDFTWNNDNRDNAKVGKIRKNMVVLSGKLVKDIGFLPVTDEIDAEFVGLAYFGPAAVRVVNKFFKETYPEYLGKPFEQAKDIKDGYLTDLLRYFIRRGIKVEAVDIGSEWAEIESPQRFSKFVLGTKGETLERLSKVIKKGKFCKQCIFTIEEWRKDKKKVLTAIKEEYESKQIVVRSSSTLEDLWHSSNPGVYKSILNVDPSLKESTIKAIEEVIESYKNGGKELDFNEQVLVQEQVDDVVVSGVVFTKDLDAGAPYYVVNYDSETSRTDTVTSGNHGSLQTILVSRSFEGNISMPRIAKLLEVVRELEKATSCNILDIEFAINKCGDVFILQVRPISVLYKQDGFLEVSIETGQKVLNEFLKHRFQRVAYLFGETTVFGDMPDWNPAEIIGIRPHPLAVSLYQYLITDSVWRISRGRIGYIDPAPAVLMHMLDGHPFIDTRCSFNSFIPKGLSHLTSEKLVNHYVNTLKENRDMHDKIEFEICFTCLDFDFDYRSKNLKEGGFSEEEILELREALFKLTNNIITGKVEPIEKQEEEIKILDGLRYKVLRSAVSGSGIPFLISQLMDNCITHGTIPFSILARYAFISRSLLDSLVRRGAITEEDMHDFFSSLKTIAAEFVHDMDKVMKSEMSRDEFLSIYGHLRPGSYDIRSMRYDEAPDIYFPEEFNDPSKKDHVNAQINVYTTFKLKPEKRKAVNVLLKEVGFTFSVDEMFEFMRKAISAREWAKFEFTKSISDALVLLEQIGEEYGISRSDLSYLNIESVRKWSINTYPSDIRSRMQTEIAHGKKWYKRSQMTKLPYIITSLKDVSLIELKQARPNFVTKKKVTVQSVSLDNSIKQEGIKGKIVLIESADPGYDWIFLHDISGLVTKYGGAASHMTIRAAEFGIPAAIGCGEVLFERLEKGRVINLDCSTKRIHAL